MVTVVKTNKLRIFVDPKDLNRAIKRCHYRMLTIEEVATKLSNVKVFITPDSGKFLQYAIGSVSVTSNALWLKFRPGRVSKKNE